MTSVSLIWFHVNLTLCVTLLKHMVSRWSFDSQGFVFVFSEDLVIRLQSKPLGKNTTTKKERLCLIRHRTVKTLVRTNELFRLTCQGNLCPQQLKCRARDFPSQRVCFHCGETKTYCIMQTPTHQLCTNRGHKQSAVIQKSSVSDLLN